MSWGGEDTILWSVSDVAVLVWWCMVRMHHGTDRSQNMRHREHVSAKTISTLYPNVSLGLVIWCTFLLPHGTKTTEQAHLADAAMAKWRSRTSHFEHISTNRGSNLPPEHLCIPLCRSRVQRCCSFSSFVVIF